MLLGLIGALTLAIGGIGLANIMLVSVTQRTREIGVLKSIGATRGAILFQFLRGGDGHCHGGGNAGRADWLGGDGGHSDTAAARAAFQG